MDPVIGEDGAECYLPFIGSVSLIVAGASFSGKTTFVADLIKNRARMFRPEPVEILFAYTTWQPLYEDLEKTVPNITFINRIPSKEEVLKLTEDGQHRLLLLDDKMTEMNSCPNLTEYFTVFTHHRNLSTIILLQNIFYQGAKCLRDITLNVQGIVLFQNKRSPRQIGDLASQMFLGHKRAWFLNAYEKACAKPYGYLFVDLSSRYHDKFQLRTDILPGQTTRVFLPSGGGA